MAEALGARPSHYRISGHALLRYSSAYLIDPATAALRIQEELLQARPLATEQEAGQVIGASLRFHPGHSYVAGPTGVYVLRENVVITYIDRSGKFRSRKVRGFPQRSRSGRMKAGVGNARRHSR